MPTYGYMYCIPGSSRAHGYMGTLLRIQSYSCGGGVLPWECRTLRFIKNTSVCRPNRDVTTTLDHELVILSLIPILWVNPNQMAT
jgi:hypothetical protein